MKYPENILEVSQLLPDYLGFIFYKKSARYFDGVLPELPKSIQKTGVFVNAPFEEINAKIEQYDLQLIQLHGNETPEFCSRIRNLKKIQIIKAFSVDSTFDFETLKSYEAVCDYFLLDAKGKLHGGNGISFDWTLLNKCPTTKPLFLSGGIGIREYKKIKKLNISVYGIDVNSKFEIKPGLKNTTAIHKLFLLKKQNNDHNLSR